ncbi:50S ribosomal protein L36 [Blastomyces gilchristii SLH14081]|uniref:50S ribosomal protein L36 n=1 Tax=Blastomyces gilchristii (strain SLH14081) TaxID=559298 RepID=A0A179UDA9_BLAGS|nr:mitochondrial 54S ribosomal protein YmL36 [Blastomyces gilchristii SLH14081]OAT05954.1 50S ribosomal protein L36 [Blastomyces gilchristii SLH14081]
MSLHLPIRRTSTTALSNPTRTTFIYTQCRHATLLRRPKRPYTFTQLITLSDGSTFTHRTTSPIAVYRSTRDTRNAPLWNPSSEKLRNVEEDEAGRLAAFRSKFGRSWDATGTAAAEGASSAAAASATPATTTTTAAAGQAGVDAKQAEDTAVEFEFEEDEEEDNLLDLISSFGQTEGSQEAQPEKGKGKGKKK